MPELPKSVSGRSARAIVTDVCAQVGDVLVRRFTSALDITYKGRGNISTDADREAEALAMQLLRKEYPGVNIMAEETAPDQASTGWTWVIDPLDGTRNFASGIPHFAVVVALSYGDQAILGATFDPIRHELFYAEKGAGATLNGKPIHVSNKQTLQESVLGFDLSYKSDEARKSIHLLDSLWPGMQTARVMGSAALALAYVAAGRLDLYFHPSLYPWDIASGLVLIPEAGGLYTDRKDVPGNLRSSTLVVANPILHKRFMEATKGHEWRTA